MKRITLFLLASCLAASAATEEQINKRFAVQPGGRVVVDVDFGSIDVSTNSTSEVVVDVWRKVSRKNKKAEEEFLTDSPVQIAQDGSTVTIRSHRSSKLGRANWFGWNTTEAKYTVTVPAKFAAQLNTAGGGIKVNGLNGETKAHTSGGGLEFANLRGDLNGETSGGGIRANDCAGNLKIHTSGGGLHIDGGEGKLDGGTSGGSVTVLNFRGPAHVHTSGGGITVENVKGEVDGSTSGGSITASFANELPGPVKLETSGGGITVRLPDGVGFDLDAATSAGGVSSDFPVTTTVSDSKREHGRLRGTANGGGPSIYLRTSAGSIHIRKK